MPIRMFVRLFVCALLVSAMLTDGLRAQEPGVLPEQLRLRAFLVAAYSDLDARAMQREMSPGAGGAFSVRDVTDLRDIVAHDTAPRVLQGVAQFDADGRVRAFSARGPLVKGAENLELARAVAAARRAGGSVDAEIDRRNPRFGLGSAAELLAHIDLGPGVDLANAVLPLLQASGLLGPTRPPTLRNYSSSTLVVKRESCDAGFETVQPARPSVAGRTYYRWFDGVKPPAWAHDGHADWLKVQDYSKVNIQTSGEPSSLYGLGTSLPGFCMSSGPGDPEATYRDCSGRKVEPAWSDANAFGVVDWKYPRTAPVDCTDNSPWWKRIVKGALKPQ